MFFLCLLVLNTPFLVEDFSFGFEKGENHYLWVHPQSMLYGDKNGQMILSDPSEDRVLIFDQKGEFQREVGGKGSGPGEFVGLLSLRPTIAGPRAISIDQIIPTFHVFDSKYQFKSRKSAQGPPLILIHAEMSPLGDCFAAFYLTIDREAGVNRFSSGIFSPDFTLIHQIDSHPGMISDPSKLQSRSYWVERLSENMTRYFQNRIHFAYAPSGDLFFSGNRKLDVHKVSNGKSSSVFQHDLTHEPLGDLEKEAILDTVLEEIRSDRDLMEIITPSVVEEATQKADIPGTKDHVYGLIPLDDNHILVVTKVDHNSGQQWATLFRNGEKLGSQALQGHAFTRLTHAGYVPAMTIQDKKAYALKKTEDGELKAVRFTINLPD